MNTLQLSRCIVLSWPREDDLVWWRPGGVEEELGNVRDTGGGVLWRGNDVVKEN